MQRREKSRGVLVMVLPLLVLGVGAVFAMRAYKGDVVRYLRIRQM